MFHLYRCIFFFFISNLTDFNILSWQKRGKDIEIDAINY